MGERFIKNLIRSQIKDLIEKYVKDPKDREEAIDGLIDISMYTISIIGVRQFIKFLWCFKKQMNSRSIKSGEPDFKLREENVTKDT